MDDIDYSALAPNVPHPALLLGCSSPKTFESVEDRIKNAMSIMAQIIAEEGDEYLPIFLRLEEELEAYQSRSKALQRASALLQSSKLYTKENNSDGNDGSD